MAFVKKTWKDRISQYPNRRTINDGTTTKVVTVGRDEGTITEQGDPFNAAVMNDMEDRIEAGLAEKPDREEVEDMVTDFFPLGEASGTIASFNPGVVMPLKSCECQINAYQASGTPTPASPLPITGFSQADIAVSGINIWDEQWEIGGYDQNGQPNTATNRIRTKNYIPVKGDTKYYLHCQNNVAICYYDINKDFVLYAANNANSTFTTPNNCAFIRFSPATAYGTTYNNDISINYPSTDTQYHAYKGNSYLVEFGQTIYGGKINVTTGELIVTHGYVDLGSLTWVIGTGGAARFVATTSPTPKATGEIIADCLQTATNTQIYNGSVDKAIAIHTNNAIWARDTDYTVASDFTTAMQGHYAAYELATPFVYNLDPVVIKTLFNQNNIYHDCNGNIDIIFHKEITAKNISFDNSGTTLTATNVEDAIKEVLGRI